LGDIVGTTLKGRYRIDAFVGRGGMAEVYKAYDTRRGYDVAIKVMRDELAEDQEFVSRFQQEAKSLSKLSHENIVRFYSFERQGPLAFIVMDYVEGVTLRTLIADADGALPRAQVWSTFRQVCQALHYAHEEGVIHRDVKPGNIIIRSDGKVLMSDFGISKMADASTLTTYAPGTPAYMSPEQCRGQPVDRRSDVYSLAIVLFQMLTGRRPFVGDTDALPEAGIRERIRWEQMNRPPPSPRQFNPDLSEDVERAILKALSKNTNERFPTTFAFLEALPEALGTERLFAPISRTAAEDPAAQQLYNQAREAIDAADWTGAIELLNRILALHGPFRDTVERLTEANRQKHLTELWRQANAAYEAENWAEAIAFCAEIIGLDPGYPGANQLLKEASRAQRLAKLYQEGTQALADHDWSGAIDKLASVIETDPGYLDAAALLAQAREAKAREERLAELRQLVQPALEGKRWKEAAAAFEEIVSLDPGDAEAAEQLAQTQNAYREQLDSLWQQTQEAQAAGRWPEALAALQELIGLEPDEGRYQEALLAVHMARSRAERLALLRQRGLAALEGKRWPEAVAAFEEMFALDPADEQTIERLAQAQSAYRGQLDSLWRESQEAQAAWRWPQAQAALRRLVELEPEEARYRQALEALDAAKERAERLTKLQRRGLVALKEERWPEAISAFEEMLALAPDNADASGLLSRAQAGYRSRIAELWQATLEARGEERWPEALAALQELVELAPQDGRYRQALEEIQAAQARAEHLALTYRRGQEALEAGDWRTAIDALSEVVEREPEYDHRVAAALLVRARREMERAQKVTALLSLARERMRAGLWAEAIEAAREAVELAPDSPEAQDLLALAENTVREAEIAELKAIAEKALADGLWERAAEKFQKALQLAPEDEALKRGLRAAQKGTEFQVYVEKLETEAETAWEMKDWEAAAGKYTELAGLFPADGVYRSRRDTASRELQRQTKIKRLEAEAEEACRLGDWEAASAIYEELTALAPREHAYSALLAEAQEKAARREGIESLEALAEAARHTADWAAAVATLKEMVELDPANVVYRQSLAEAQARAERDARIRELERETTAARKAANWEEAISLCAGLLELDPGNEKYSTWLEEAQEALARKTSLAAQLALAWERLAAQDWEGAVGAARVALELAPDSAEARALLSEAKTGVQEAAARPRAITAKAGQRLEGHSDSVFNVAFSPVGALLASASNDHTICLWRGPDWEMLNRLKGHGDSVYGVAFSPDGALLASAGRDETVRLWEVESGEMLFVFEGHSGPVRCVAFSPGGKLLASGGDDGTVRVWNVQARRGRKPLPGHTQAVHGVAFDPDGALLASGGGDGEVFLWEIEKKRLARKLEGHSKPVLSVAVHYSPGFDTTVLASGGRDNMIRLWDVGSGEMLHLQEGHKDWVLGVAFSPDGELLASGSWDKTVRLWDVASGKMLTALEGHEDWVGGVAFSPDGSLLASASWDGTVRIWQVVAG
jgi:WD40 repeat protein/serine/threonine protein kinase